MDSRDRPLSYQSVAKANKANVEPPMEYDLPLAEGIISQSAPKYWKDGSNNVGISGVIRFNEKPVSSQVIAVLPVGYRPITSKNLVVQMSASPHVSVYGWIHTDGKVRLAKVSLSDDFIGDCGYALIASPFYAGQ